MVFLNAVWGQRVYLYTNIFIYTLEVSREVLIEAARMLAVANTLRLPDAIHGATARLTECETFLTNDRRLVAIPEIEIVLLSELIR